MDSITERVMNGEYNSKVEWPKTPEKPAVLGKRVMDLSAEDMANLAQVKAQYEADFEAYKQQKRQHSASEQEGIARLRRDLEAEYGMVGNAKADRLWRKAWEHGHSSGLEEVVQWYDDLWELVN
jgi:flagellar biosynthesis/type III secretory pathway protein FliH